MDRSNKKNNVQYAISPKLFRVNQTKLLDGIQICIKACDDFSNMFNSKHSKSSLGNAFMASAIALVLVMGTGFSSMQSFGLEFDALPGFDVSSKFGQSADCAGMLNDCGNDNSVQNPPAPTPVEECVICLAELTDEQENTLLQVLNVETLAEACALDDISGSQFYSTLIFLGFSEEEIADIYACLDLELP